LQGAQIGAGDFPPFPLTLTTGRDPTVSDKPTGKSQQASDNVSKPAFRSVDFTEHFLEG